MINCQLFPPKKLNKIFSCNLAGNHIWLCGNLILIHFTSTNLFISFWALIVLWKWQTTCRKEKFRWYASWTYYLKYVPAPLVSVLSIKSPSRTPMYISKRTLCSLLQEGFTLIPSAMLAKAAWNAQMVLSFNTIKHQERDLKIARPVPKVNNDGNELLVGRQK